MGEKIYILKDLINKIQDIKSIINDDLDLSYDYNEDKREKLEIEDNDIYYDYLGKLNNSVYEIEDYCYCEYLKLKAINEKENEVE